MTLVVRGVEPRDLGTMLRPADVEECEALGLHPQEVLVRSVAGSDTSIVHSLDGDVMAIWGWRADSIVPPRASAWLLSTSKAEGARVMFARESMRMLEGLLEEFVSVTVEVHAKHLLSVKWLGWLGFRAIGATWYGEEKFLLMRKERD